jgi:hypothetical protein
MNRQRRKQNNAVTSSGIDTSSLLDNLNAVGGKYDSLEDLVTALFSVLKAYGCIVQTNESGVDDITAQCYRITTAGENIGLLGLDNALWFLSAMGGAWDVTGASTELDKLKIEMKKLDSYDTSMVLDDDSDLFDDDNSANTPKDDPSDEVNKEVKVPLPQIEP